MTDLSHMTTPDTRPGPYYVSAINAGKVHTMAGPYAEHGADPATHTLALPEAYRAGIPYRPPSYVRFSTVVTAPTLIRRLTVGLAIPPTF